MSRRRRCRRMEHQRKTVDAIAQARGLRAVVEDVAEMAAAAAAMHFGAQHAKGAVLDLADGIFDRLVEARPAGAALELGVGGKQRQVAAGAGEDALAVLFQQRAGARPFGAVLAQDVVLHRRQLRAPFRVGFLDLEFLRGFSRRHPQPAECSQPEQAGKGSKQDTAVKHGTAPEQWVASRYDVWLRKLQQFGGNSLTILRAILASSRRTPGPITTIDQVTQSAYLTLDQNREFGGYGSRRSPG